MSFRPRMRLRVLFVVYSRLSLTVIDDYYWHTHLCCQGYPAAGSAGTNWMEVLLTYTCSQCLHKGTALCNCSTVPWGYMKCNGPFITDPSPEGVTINSLPSVFMVKDIAKSVIQWIGNFNGESTQYHHQDVLPSLSHPWSNQKLRRTDCIYLHKLRWTWHSSSLSPVSSQEPGRHMQDCKAWGEALKCKGDVCLSLSPHSNDLPWNKLC